MTNDRGVAIGKFFFDLVLEQPATHVDRVWDMQLVELILVANIDDYRVAAALRFRRGIGRRNFGDLLFRVRDEILEAFLLSHGQNLTADYADETDNSEQ